MPYLYIDYDEGRDCGIIKSDYLANIREYFSEVDEKAGLKKRFLQKRFQPSRRYIITEQGRFDFGMIIEIVKYLKSIPSPFKITFSEAFKKRYSTVYPFHNDELSQLKLPYRNYQEAGIRAGLKNGCGLILHPTGGGKTLSMAGLLTTVLKYQPNSKMLVILPTPLINQTYQDFLSYGINPDFISKWSGEHELNMASKIVIAGTNILYPVISNISLELKKVRIVELSIQKELQDTTITPEKRKHNEAMLIEIAKDKIRLQESIETNKIIHKYLSTIDLLMIDEVHHFKKDNKLQALLKFIPSRHRYGYTGTLPESSIDKWFLIGNIGPIVYEISRDVLVEQEFITSVDIKVLEIHYKTPLNMIYHDEKNENDEKSETTKELSDKIRSLSRRYRQEIEFIQKDLFRNNIIKKCCAKLDKNILIPVDRIEHGELLLSYLTTSLPDKKVYFIKGEVENEERDKIKEIMENNHGVICIAISRIFSTGINIKNLHYIILALPGKAKNKIIQTIGRGVRRLNDVSMKTKVVIIDIVDHLEYGLKHFEKRKLIYDEEKFKYQITTIHE